MSLWSLSAVTLLYLWTAFDLAATRNYPLALVFVAYAVANVGLMWAIWK